MLHSAQQKLSKKIQNNKSEISFNHFYFNQTRNPPDIDVARIFDWGGGGANHKSHAMTSSEISERALFFVGAKIS